MKIFSAKHLLEPQAFPIAIFSGNFGFLAVKYNNYFFMQAAYYYGNKKSLSAGAERLFSVKTIPF